MSTVKLAVIGLLSIALMAVAGAAAYAAAPDSNESQQHLQDICGNTSFPKRCIDALSRAPDLYNPRTLFRALFQEAAEECKRAKRSHMIPYINRNRKGASTAAAADVRQCCSDFLDVAVENIKSANTSLDQIGSGSIECVSDMNAFIGTAAMAVQMCYRPYDCDARGDFNEELKAAVKGVE